MKLTPILFLFYVSVFTQTTWLDNNWNITTKEKGIYYRPTPSPLKKGFWIIDYYKSGKVKREGFSKKLNSNSFDGLVIEYFENGKPSIRKHYKNGKLHGLHKEFFETGELKIQYRYKEGKQNGVWKEFYKSGKIKTKGKYKEGEKVGVWKTFYKNVYDSFLDY